VVLNKKLITLERNHPTYIRHLAVQYLQQLMSIYKSTSMKLLKKKYDFSAVEFRL
jgi:hypothetical protein